MGTATPVEIDFPFKVNLFVCNLFRRKYEQIEVRECLLSFGTEYFVFRFATPRI